MNIFLGIGRMRWIVCKRIAKNLYINEYIEALTGILEYINVFSHCYVIQTNVECIVPIGQWVIVADIWVKDIENKFFLISSVSFCTKEILFSRFYAINFVFIMNVLKKDIYEKVFETSIRRWTVFCSNDTTLQGQCIFFHIRPRQFKQTEEKSYIKTNKKYSLTSLNATFFLNMLIIETKMTQKNGNYGLK